MDTFVYKDHKKLRCGYTTGTCAALAAQGAVRFLLTGSWKETEEIMTPKGIPVSVSLEEKSSGDGWAECAVRKDAGDDYDVTNGILVYARAEFVKNERFCERSHMAHLENSVSGSGRESAETGLRLESGKHQEKEQFDQRKAELPEDFIKIDGGIGIGRVTKPGLDQPVGAAAINSVPRKMIRDAVCSLLEEAGELRPVSITISIPAGVEAAKKTFNPVLGIEGGISVLGTSGIVEPMSEEALVDTIRAHLNVLKAGGRKWVIAVPGNMGAGFLERYLAGRSKNGTGPHPESAAVDAGLTAGERPSLTGLSTEKESLLAETFMNSLVTMSNFVGKTIDLAAELGFSGILIAGHMGKLVKIGNGIMNTHSREADGRMDTLLSCALSAGTEDLELLKKIQGSNTTDEAMDHLKQAGILEDTIKIFLKRAAWHLAHRSRDEVKTGMIVFGTKGEYLGETEDAEKILENALNEMAEKDE